MYAEDWLVYWTIDLHFTWLFRILFHSETHNFTSTYVKSLRTESSLQMEKETISKVEVSSYTFWGSTFLALIFTFFCWLIILGVLFILFAKFCTMSLICVKLRPEPLSWSLIVKPLIFMWNMNNLLRTWCPSTSLISRVDTYDILLCI